MSFLPVLFLSFCTFFLLIFLMHFFSCLDFCGTIFRIFLLYLHVTVTRKKVNLTESHQNIFDGFSKNDHSLITVSSSILSWQIAEIYSQLGDCIFLINTYMYVLYETRRMTSSFETQCYFCSIVAFLVGMFATTATYCVVCLL